MPLIGPEALDGLLQYMSGTSPMDEDKSGFPDKMLRLKYSEGTRDQYNRKTPQYAPFGQLQVCRIRPLTPREISQLGSNQTPTGDNMLHLPLDADLTFLDHIRQVERWGVTLVDPVEYSVVGKPVPNALEFTVQLKLQTNVRE